jgi:photoactive yellow protein
MFVDVISSNRGAVECAWCGKSIKAGDPSQPKFHGICLSCMGSVSSFLIEDLNHIPPEAFDLLPYGTIMLKGDGTVTGYSRKEAELSGLDPQKVVGRNFFRDIAPCTLVKEFAGEFELVRRLGEDARKEIQFLFKFARGAVLVKIVIVYVASSDSAVLLVKPVATESPLPN